MARRDLSKRLRKPLVGCTICNSCSVSIAQPATPESTQNQPKSTHESTQAPPRDLEPGVRLLRRIDTAQDSIFLKIFQRASAHSSQAFRQAKAPAPLSRARTAPERSPHRAPRSDTDLRPHRARAHPRLRVRPVHARRLRSLRLPNPAGQPGILLPAPYPPIRASRRPVTTP